MTQPSDGEVLQERFARRAARARETPCACGALDWGDEYIVAAPIVGSVFMAEQPFLDNDLLLIGVMVCRACETIRQIRLGRVPVPTE